MGRFLVSLEEWAASLPRIERVKRIKKDCVFVNKLRCMWALHRLKGRLHAPGGKSEQVMCILGVTVPLLLAPFAGFAADRSASS